MTEPTPIATVIAMPSKKPVAQVGAARPFMPYHETCERHGDWQVNFLDENGSERCRAGCPECKRELAAFSALRGARIPPKYQHASLDNYVATLPGQMQALRACQDYVARFDEHAMAGRCLMLSGTTGTGKTHLSCGIGNALLPRRKTVLFCTVSELMDEFAATWRRDSQSSERDVVNAFAAADLLILDDVGVQNGSNQESLSLYRVINARSVQGKPTVVSSNLDLDGTRKALGIRTFDRVCENGGIVVVCNWPSHRLGGR